MSVNFRVTDEEKASLEHSARTAGMELSKYCREILLRASGTDDPLRPFIEAERVRLFGIREPSQ